MIVLASVFSVLASFDLSQLKAESGLNMSSPQHKDVFRFEVRDGESDQPLPNTSVTVVLWQHDNGAQRRKELEGRTDENGVVVFPKVQVEKLTVSVEAKGYRSISRWINPKDFDRAIRIRLDFRRPWYSCVV